MKTQTPDPFIPYLLSLHKQDDRAALAALRSGLGKLPGQATRMFPYVLQFLREGDEKANDRIQALFLTASLFATHPQHDGAQGNLGASLRASLSKHGEDGVTRRLTAALDADPEDLPKHLPSLVSLCESAQVPINWTKFYWDVKHLLGHDEEKRDKARINWAKRFWQSRADSAPTGTNPSETDQN